MVEGLSYHRASMDPLQPDGSTHCRSRTEAALHVPDMFDENPPHWLEATEKRSTPHHQLMIMNIIFLEDGSPPLTFDDDFPNLPSGLEQST